jgi:hypothetical protein
MEMGPSSSRGDLFTSVLIATVLFFLLSNTFTFYLTEPLMNDSSLMTQARPVITRDALDTIGEDQGISIVGTGSSMTFKGLDGKCIGENLENNATVYNIAQLNSLPWNDMVHIPRMVQSNPDIVLIEIGPGILTNLSSEKSIEHAIFRYKLDTSYQDSNDLGGWVDLIDPRMKDYVAENDYKRMEFRQEYVPAAIEEHLMRLILDESAARDEWTYGWTPNPDGSNWDDYLQLPTFPPDSYGFDGMTAEERLEYNQTKMDDAANYKPMMESQAHTALDYEIKTLVENGVKVILVGLPHHPDSIDYVPHGKWDSVNTTMAHYAELPGVTVFNQIWENGWVDDHFYDRNHLDDEGRIEFCHRLAPTIDQVLNE